jgi:hypothetical protein
MKKSKIIAGVAALVFLSGCSGVMLKSTVVKDLQPVADGLSWVAAVDCSLIPDSRCPAAKDAAKVSLGILSQLGVQPSVPPVPPAPAQ